MAEQLASDENNPLAAIEKTMAAESLLEVSRSAIRFPTQPEQTANREQDKSENSEEVTAAAEALWDVHLKAAQSMRRLINTFHGNIAEAVKAIYKQGTAYPLNALKSAEDLAFEKRKRAKKARYDAALQLVQLSGQDPDDSRAALVLLNLRRAWVLSVLKARIVRGQAGAETTKERERETAMAKFRKQYPHVLRTSRRGADGRFQEVV